MLRQPKRRTVRVEGADVSLLEWGEPRPGKWSFVYLHGLIATAETASGLADALDPQAHVLAVDLPGAGYTSRGPEIAADLRGMAKLIRGLLDLLRLERVVLLGHSHGGAVGLQLATGDPGPVESMVLLSPAHPFSTHADRLIRFYLSAPGRGFAYVLPWLPRRVHLLGFRQMAGPGSWSDPRQVVPYTANLRTPGTVRHLLRVLAAWQADMARLGEALRACPVKIPTLLLWGDQDRAVPHTTAPALQAHLRNAACVVLPGVGHRPAEEAATTCSRLIQDWLAGQTPDPLPGSGLRPNWSLSQDRSAAAKLSSLDAGDSGVPAKK
jgi:pimeloyl-ACP methyl ester carboxylesterase